MALYAQNDRLGLANKVKVYSIILCTYYRLNQLSFKIKFILFWFLIRTQVEFVNRVKFADVSSNYLYELVIIRMTTFHCKSANQKLLGAVFIKNFDKVNEE